MNRLNAFFLAFCLFAFSSVAAYAGMSPGDTALVLSGLTSSDTIFFRVGGSILVILAGMWGFRKVMGLMGYK